MPAMTPGEAALLAIAAPSVSGVAAGTWAKWTGTATGVRTVAGVASATWAKWTGNVDGSPQGTGTATGTWAGWTGTAAGLRTVSGVASASWAKWTGAAVASGATLAYREIEIDNTAGGAKTNWQVRVDLDAGNFDFASINDETSFEFRADDGSTVLAWWCEALDVPGETAALWVKVPSIDAADTATVRLYYGTLINGSPSAADTFIVGEDFRSVEPLESVIGGTFGTSVDLVNRNGYPNPIAVHGGTGWRQTQVREQSNIVWTGTEYVILVTGRTTTGTASCGLYYATDITGTWTEYASNPVIPLSEDPYITVNVDGSLYTDGSGWHYVTFERKQANSGSSELDVGVARTKNFRTDWEVWNGSAWTTSLSTHAIVLARGTSGAWDDHFAQSPCVVWDGTQAVCLYEGASDASTLFTGVARSADHVTWVKEATNPVSTSDVVDDVYFDGSAWWMAAHGGNGDQYRLTTTDDPADWDSSSWTLNPAAAYELGGHSVNLASGTAAATRFATYQQTIGTTGIELFNWAGPDWTVHRSDSGRVFAVEADVVDDTLRLTPLDSGASNNDIALYTVASPVTSNFEIVARRKVTAQTDDQNAGIAVGSGTIVKQSNIWLTFSDGYVFNVLNPDEAIQIRKYTAGSFVNTTTANALTTADAQAFGRHAMSYLATGELDYKVNGTSRVSRTDTAHVAAAKQIMLWQSNNTTRRGGVSHYEWVVVRQHDGVDLSVSVGAETGLVTVGGIALGAWAGWTGAAVGTRTASGVAAAVWPAWTGLASVVPPVSPFTTNAARHLTPAGLVATLRRDAELVAALPLLACPKCGEPLDMARGLAHCPMGHFTQPA
jgi:hypothetical protein